MFALKPKQSSLLAYSMADSNYIPGVTVRFLWVITVPNKICLSCLPTWWQEFN